MNPPPPDVIELMERIRQEAGAHQRQNGDSSPDTELELPAPAAPLPPPPRPVDLGPVADEPAWAAVPGMVQRALRKITVSEWVPRFLRPLSRNQGGFNGILLEAVERLGENNRQLQDQIETLLASLQAQSAWLAALAQAREAESGWMRAADAYLRRNFAESNAHRRRAGHGEARLARLEEQHTYTRSDVDQLSLRTGYVEAQAGGIDERLGHLQSRTDEQAGRLQGTSAQADRLGDHLVNLQRQADSQDTHLGEVHAHLDRVGERINQLGEHVNDVQRQADGQNEHLTEVHQHLDRIGHRVDQISDHSQALKSQQTHNQQVGEHLGSLQKLAEGQNQHNQRVDQHLGDLQKQADRQNEDIHQADGRTVNLEAAARHLDERQVADASYLKSQLALLGRLVQRLLEPAVNGASGDGQPASVRLADAAEEFHQHGLDAFYLAFEDRFRGTRAEIIARAEVHLSALETARVGRAESPVLDLGCGRGEWLELLRDRGFTAAGVDLNANMIEQCRERGLEVASANVLDFLRELPEASRGAITAFHLIEHLPFRELFNFVHECHRVLQPGGVVIFETPNPENIVVGATEFWGDYTHQRPVPPASAAFLVEQAGFVEVRVLPLHPVPEEPDPNPGTHSVVWERVHALLYGPRDYAVVATKACT